MKSSKLLLPIALVSALTIGTPNISALGRPYNGEEWMTIDPSSGRVTLYPIDGVQMSQNEDGTINLDTSIPNDTSKWDSQVSGVGSTQSYIYVGFHIKPVEGAVKLKSTCDAVNNTMDSAEITSDIDNVQCWFPIANYDNGAYSLFGSGRVYDALFEWYDEDDEIVSKEIISSTRNIQNPNTFPTIERQEVDSARISLPADLDGVFLEDGVLYVSDIYPDNTVILNVKKPDNSVEYSHYVASNGGKIALNADGIAEVPVSLGSEQREVILEWYTDEEQAVTFEKITLTLKGGNKEIFDEENGMGAIFAEAPIFLPNYRLEIKDITDTHMDSLADKLKVNESLTQLFDINVKNSLGEIVDFGNSDSSYDVYIRLDDEFDLTAKYVVIYVDDAGEVAERIEARIVNGNEGANYLVFTANHLSKYGIVKVTESEEPTVDVENPNTGDKFSFFASALTVSSLVLAGVYLYTKRA